MRNRIDPPVGREHDITNGAILGDRYVLGELLGKGGMGRVFRAEQISLSRTVAVKLLRRSVVGDPMMRRRFQEEARTAGLLRHPSAVHVIDYGVSDAFGPFMVMEYVSGPTLAAVVARDGALPLHRIARLVGQILSALGEVHAAGVVHADLKSENVIIEGAGTAAERPKLIDFGLATRRAPLGQCPAAGVEDETISGTPDYVAPEVILGRGARPASDLYAVGIILYELLTGETPFAGGEPGRILERHLRDAVVPPSLRRPDRTIPPPLDQLVACALAKEPDRRFADAAAYRAALVHAIRGLTVDALRRCPACGEPRSGELGDCGACGMSRGVPGEHTDEPTENLMPARPQPRMAHGSRPADGQEPAAHPSKSSLRSAIANSLLRGDVEEIAVTYLALARSLAAEGRVGDAVVELREGIDVLTAGVDASAGVSPVVLPQLYRGLAALHALAGNQQAARRAASEAATLRRGGSRCVG